MAARHIGSKWKKTAALLKFEHLRKFVPKTVKLGKTSLKDMLDRYGMVYVKPDVGTYGGGVMRVEARSDGRFSYQLGVSPRTFSSYSALYADLQRATRGRRYLVQKGISLLKYNKRRFDIRVMVQTTPQKSWETTALIGRVAAPRKVVTNYHNGGTPMAVETLMEPHLSGERKRQFISGLRTMGVHVAKGLQATYPGIREIGIDVGVDSSCQPWILEVNTCPDPYIFRHLKDKSIVRKVIRYAIAYGRIKPRKSKPTSTAKAAPKPRRLVRTGKRVRRGPLLRKRNG